MSGRCLISQSVFDARESSFRHDGFRTLADERLTAVLRLAKDRCYFLNDSNGAKLKALMYDAIRSLFKISFWTSQPNILLVHTAAKKKEKKNILR